MLVRLVVAAIACMAIYSVLSALFTNDLSDSVAELTLEELDDAKTKWKQNGPDSYELEVHYNSSDAEMYIQIVVVNKAVVSGIRDGTTLDEADASRWTIPGQFVRIREDVIAMSDRSKRPNIREDARLVPRAEFDPKFGYPVRYELKGIQTPLQYEWEVTRFEVGTPGR